eukprot:2441763-Pleurochrysis_carterae.AAC.1
MARGNPYELGGQITQPELSRGDAPWAGYDTLTIQPESDFEGCDSDVRGMLDMAKARYLGAVEEAAKRSGARRSR